MRRGTWMTLAILVCFGSATVGAATCHAQAPPMEEAVPAWPVVGPRGGGPPPDAPPGPHGWGRGISTYVPNAAGRPSPTPWVVTQGGVYLHQPKHRQPPCQRPTSICIKPKVWTFSQAFYSLNHEVWYGVTDPCWLMNPDCCGTSCNAQNSFGLMRLFPWADKRRNCSGCQQCSGGQPARAGCQQCGADGMPEGAGPGPQIEYHEITPTPAEPPVEHPKAAQAGPIRSVLLKRE